MAFNLMGLLSGITGAPAQPQGALGGAVMPNAGPQPAQPQQGGAGSGGGLLGGLSDFIDRNQMLLAQVGAGLMNSNGQGMAGALANAGAAFGPAMMEDRRRNSATHD